MEETLLLITEKGKDDLITTAKWTYFYAIISLIGAAFQVLTGIILLVSKHVIGNQQIELSTTMLIPLGIIYILLGAILIIPAVYLLYFAEKTEKAIAENDVEMMEQAINRMKSYWKFMGILTIVLLGAALLVVPVAVVGAFLL